MSHYYHPYSDYFDAVAGRGVMGSLAFLFLLGMPEWLCKGCLDGCDPRLRVRSWAAC